MMTRLAAPLIIRRLNGVRTATPDGAQYEGDPFHQENYVIWVITLKLRTSSLPSRSTPIATLLENRRLHRHKSCITGNESAFKTATRARSSGAKRVAEYLDGIRVVSFNHLLMGYPVEPELESSYGTIAFRKTAKIFCMARKLPCASANGCPLSPPNSSQWQRQPGSSSCARVL